MPNTQNKILV